MYSQTCLKDPNSEIYQIHVTLNYLHSESILAFLSVTYVNIRVRASKRNLARRNKTALGPRGQAETSINIEDFS
jgi:hypothetical protein